MWSNITKLTAAFCSSGNLPKNGCISLKLFTRNLHGPNSDSRLQVLVFVACQLILGRGVVDIKVVLENEI
jgi:hypothetical protein